MKNIYKHNKANEQIWDRRAKTYGEKGNFYHRFQDLQKEVISTANLQNNTNFLDLGCGPGWAVCYVSSLLNGQGYFVGIDISQGMIEKAKQNALGLKNIVFYKASAEELPLENDFFTIIICANSFHHYLNPIKALTEIYRVLKQGGRIYIVDTTTDDFFPKCWDRLSRIIEKGHVKHYSTIEYKDMFSQVGLKHIESKSITIAPNYIQFRGQKIHIAEK